MPNLWSIFMAHWLLIFALIIGAGVLTIGFIKLAEEIRFQWERRRYRRARM